MKNDCMHSMRDRASGVEMLGSGQFYGTNVRSWRRPGMMLSETHYSPNLKVPRHEHEPAYFCFLLDGGYWEQYGSRRVTYRPHSIVFHPAGDLHRGRIGSSGGRCFNIQLKPEWLNRMRQHDEVPDEPVDRHSGELVWLGLRMHRVFRRREPGSDLTVEGLTLEMLGSLLAENRKLDPRIPEWLKAADEIVHEDFTAIMRFRIGSRARNTLPIPPSPNFLINWWLGASASRNCSSMSTPEVSDATSEAVGLELFVATSGPAAPQCLQKESVDSRSLPHAGQVDSIMKSYRLVEAGASC